MNNQSKLDLNRLIGGNGIGNDLGEKATTHDFKYTPQKFPASGSGAVTYICSGMPAVYLSHPAYALHKKRSLWMGEGGKLGLLIGKFDKIDLIIPGSVNTGLFSQPTRYRWYNNSFIQWTKPGALKIGKEHFIKFRILLLPLEYHGATCVELDGDVCLTWFNEQRV